MLEFCDLFLFAVIVLLSHCGIGLNEKSKKLVAVYAARYYHWQHRFNLTQPKELLSELMKTFCFSLVVIDVCRANLALKPNSIFGKTALFPFLKVYFDVDTTECCYMSEFGNIFIFCQSCDFF